MSTLAQLSVLAPHQLADTGDARLKTDEKKRARTALLATMNRTNKTARFIASSVPGFDDPFKLPRSESDAALLYTARLFVERATACADLFIKFSMPADFIAEMNTHIRNIEQAIESREAILKRLKGTTAAIDAGLKECMNTLFKLDIVMANTLRDDPVTRTAWNSARHVKRAPQKKKAASIRYSLLCASRIAFSAKRSSRLGSFTTLHSLLKIIVARWARLNAGQFGRSG